MQPRVSVTIVTFNDAHNIVRCLDSLSLQSYPDLEVIVVDNASTDDTLALIKQFPGVVTIANSFNRGFSAAQNQAIAAAGGDWIFCLNPDTRLHSDCIRQLVVAGLAHPRVGIVCPKILRMSLEGKAPDPPQVDSAGGYITPSLRHFDRGSQEIDYGQYDVPEYVFGYTGAAVLFRRAMVLELTIRGNFMDEDFFFYREDADLSWRAQLFGWRCLFTPFAVAWHVRRVLPTNRRSLPALINFHSTKNRFLMRINNMTPGVYARVFVPATIRDVGVFCYVLLFERSSLPGLAWILRSLPDLWAKRREIQRQRVASERDLYFWFRNTPSARPLEGPVMERILAQQTNPEINHV